MTIEYTEWQQKTKMVDTDDFWLKWSNDGALQADVYWHNCYESGEAYCYGRNHPYTCLSHAAATERQVYFQTIIPPEIWDIPNKAFQQLMRFSL